MPSNKYTSNIKENKDNNFSTQLETIFQYLIKNIASASMISKETGIPQKNICRYKRDLEKAGKLWETEKIKCDVTGFKAWRLTTDPNKANNFSQQLNLF